MGVEILVVKRGGFKSVLERLGFQVRGNAVWTEGGSERVSCPSCDTRITVSNAGRVVPGSLHVLCDEAVCFEAYMSTTILS